MSPLLFACLAPVAAAEEPAPSPISAEEAATLLASLAGYWEGVAHGQLVAYEIQGDQVMETLGGGQIGPDRIDVISPCSLLRHGAQGSRPVPFVAHGGKVWLHEGAYAVRRGDEIWGCRAEVIVQLAADGTCTRWGWSVGMGGDGRLVPVWAPTPAECRLDGSAFVLGDTRFEDRGGFWSVEDPARALPAAPAPAPAEGDGKKPKKKKG